MSLGSYLKNNRPRSIVLTTIFVLACLVFVAGIVCIYTITQMLGTPDLPETALNQSSPSVSDSTVSSSFQGTGESQESVVLTEEELDQANANIRSRNNSSGRRPSSSATSTPPAPTTPLPGTRAAGPMTMTKIMPPLPALLPTPPVPPPAGKNPLLP